MWKPRQYPYAKALIASTNSWERKQARDCLTLMKVSALFETDQMSELSEAFWTNDFQLVVLTSDLDPKTSGEIIEMLRAVDALGPYVDRIMVILSKANLKTLHIAQALKLNCLVLKPYSIHTFCTHAEMILERTASAPPKLQPLSARGSPPSLDIDALMADAAP